MHKSEEMSARGQGKVQTDGILEILAEGGGAKTMEIQVGGGAELEKVFCRGHFKR